MFEPFTGVVAIIENQGKFYNSLPTIRKNTDESYSVETLQRLMNQMGIEDYKSDQILKYKYFNDNGTIDIMCVYVVKTEKEFYLDKWQMLRRLQGRKKEIFWRYENIINSKDKK